MAMRIEQIETNKTYIDYTTLNLTKKVLAKDLKELGKEQLLDQIESKTPSAFKKYGILSGAGEHMVL